MSAGRAVDAVDAVDVAAVVRRTWQDVLGVPGVADGDDFFASGGHSMLATRLMSRLRKAFGPRLPMGLVFEHPVFADLVGQVLASLALASGPAGPVASGRLTGPVSLQQEELLRVERILGPSPVNNVVVAVTAAAVRPETMRRALQSVQNRHAALRLGFPAGGEQFVAPPLAVSEVDLEVAVDPGDDAAVRRAVRRAHLRPFDLERGNLLRAQLFGRASGDLLVLHLHHLSVDGLSQSVLLDDLSAAYGALLGGAAPAVAAAGPSYLDYAAWQRAGHGELLAASRQHWRRVVAGLAAHRVPGGASRRVVRYLRDVVAVPAGAAGDLRAWARAEGATDFVALTSAVAAGIAAVRGRARVGIGTLLDNRSLAAFERTVGPFATSTLLAVDVEGAGTPRALVRAVRAQLAQARRWADVPLPVLLDQPCAELGLDPGELVDAVVAVEAPYRPEPDTALAFTAVPDHATPLVNAAVGAAPSVSLSLAPDGGLRIGVEAAGTTGLAGSLAAAVRNFAAAPDTPFAWREAVVR